LDELPQQEADETMLPNVHAESGWVRKKVGHRPGFDVIALICAHQGFSADRWRQGFDDMRKESPILPPRGGGASVGSRGSSPTASSEATERRQSDDAKARLAAIVESSDDAIIGETLEGVITDWNLAAERLYGYTAEEVIGRSIRMTVPGDRMGELAAYMDRVRSGERVDHLETVRLRKDGSRLDVSITVSPIRDDRGNIIGLSKSSRDITERRRFEAELWRKNIELEVANRAKDNFLASMSHELRTPLNAIIGFTATMLMKLPGALTGDQERQLQLIQLNARHLLSLINDLLNIARVQSGKAELQIEEVDCRTAVEEVVATLRPSAEAKGLTLELAPLNGECTLHTDRRSFIQILINLVTNAIKFTVSGGVRLEMERRQAGPGGRPEIDFRVMDTGLGIRQEDQGRLFRAFEQFHTQGSDEDTGSGLGLHLSQRIAGLLGGRISVQSEQGKGSMFTLTLPDR
jgi:protein-histidine pros-kinase